MFLTKLMSREQQSPESLSRFHEQQSPESLSRFQTQQTSRFPSSGLSRFGNGLNVSDTNTDEPAKQDEVIPVVQPITSRFLADSETLDTLRKKAIVKEYIPKSDRDIELPALRSLFIESFDDFYKEIEPRLQLRSDTTLRNWLNETFDEMQEEMVKKKSRVFLLTTGTSVSNILGFMQIKEENDTNTVYISQVAVHASLKRKGFGGLLLQHLLMVYPTGKTYTGLCRRANDPALQFYIKNGAVIMPDDVVAQKYGYDPVKYLGFQYVDKTERPSTSTATPAAPSHLENPADA
ncbi:unnamed protein product [Didymodactylos carnosus]|uniref:N-acetyltransferase domain-containing protein n=1 Tax=Didymodactylos carnosus TaxID=1234261 RepID=A0A8S2EY77_9BILA|nr:unnamed protein product [Didymodactylos carnosus]CAF4153611.1 unnamed protein product [Didymodactylos carnosus]